MHSPGLTSIRSNSVVMEDLQQNNTAIKYTHWDGCYKSCTIITVTSHERHCGVWSRWSFDCLFKVFAVDLFRAKMVTGDVRRESNEGGKYSCGYPEEALLKNGFSDTTSEDVSFVIPHQMMWVWWYDIRNIFDQSTFRCDYINLCAPWSMQFLMNSDRLWRSNQQDFYFSFCNCNNYCLCIVIAHTLQNS